jgi:predicted secreted hydrolase
VLSNGRGQTIHCKYTFLDSNRVQVIAEGADAPLIWTVSINGDKLNVTSPKGDGSATDTFVRVK